MFSRGELQRDAKNLNFEKFKCILYVITEYAFNKSRCLYALHHKYIVLYKVNKIADFFFFCNAKYTSDSNHTSNVQTLSK